MHRASAQVRDNVKLRQKATLVFLTFESRLLLVQQPEWLIHGCKAMEAEAWTHPTGREGYMPQQLTSWAVQPARSDGEPN